MDLKTTEDILNLIISNNTFTIVTKEKLFKEMTKLNMELHHEAQNNFYYSFLGIIDDVMSELAFSLLPSSNIYFLSMKSTGFFSDSSAEKDKPFRKWVTPNCHNNTPSYYSYDYDLELSCYSYHKEGKLFRANNGIEDFRKKNEKKIFSYSETEKQINTQYIIFKNNIISYGSFKLFGKIVSLEEILNIIPRLKSFNEHDFENIKQKLTSEEITALNLSYN